MRPSSRSRRGQRGSSTIDTGVLNPATIFFIMGLMFHRHGIGVRRGRTIRLNTLGVVYVSPTIMSSIRGLDHVRAFGREISPFQVHRAITVVSLGLLLVFVVAFILTGTESGGIALH